MRARRINLSVAALTVLALIAIGGGTATAGPEWTGFGSAAATGRGYGTPWLVTQSTTKVNPKSVRFTVSSTTAAERSTRIGWNLACWKGGEYEELAGSRLVKVSKTKPFTKTWSAAQLPLSAPQHCELEVSASHIRQGNLKATLQAKH